MRAPIWLGSRYLIPKNVYSSCECCWMRRTLTNGICARGIFLSANWIVLVSLVMRIMARKVFQLSLEVAGKFVPFFFVWPNLESDHKSLAASLTNYPVHSEHKVIVLPDDEPNYFGRIKMLAKAKAFTITKITPYYGEGVLGKCRKRRVTGNCNSFRELEAVADFGNSKTTVRLLSPIITSEGDRLLQVK